MRTVTVIQNGVEIEVRDTSPLPLPPGVKPLQCIVDDGGRHAAGFRGETGDCVVRSIAIAAQRHYREVYDALNHLATFERPRPGRNRSASRTGIHRRTFERYLFDELGATWTPTMRVGQGCRVHLREGELPTGRLVVRLSKHVTSVIDGVVRDTHDPSRGGTRCVYGYYTLPAKED